MAGLVVEVAWLVTSCFITVDLIYLPFASAPHWSSMVTSSPLALISVKSLQWPETL